LFWPTSPIAFPHLLLLLPPTDQLLIPLLLPWIPSLLQFGHFPWLLICICCTFCYLFRFLLVS
jgi:hypothetical protein